VRNNLGIGASSAAQACKVTVWCYLDTERGEDCKRSAEYERILTAAHGLECPLCGVRCALFFEEHATETVPAFLHCGCYKAMEATS
jgi:hypothetical protein